MLRRPNLGRKSVNDFLKSGPLRADLLQGPALMSTVVAAKQWQEN